MKAVKYHGPGELEFVEIPVPEVTDDTVLVKVRYCGICGTDVHAYKMPGIFDYELVLGHETVGVVEKTGSHVKNVHVGDRVAVGPPGDCGSCYSCNTGHPNTCANAFPETLGIGPNTQGAYAEYILSRHPQNELFLIPETVKDEQAVLFDVIGVGFHAVRKSRLKLGENAVVAGCGSIGLSAVQAAKLTGARTVIAFDVNPARRKMALQAGADYAFDATESGIQEAKSILVHEGGAHVTYEAAGNPATMALCADLTMANGQIMVIGSDGRPYELVSAALGPRELDFQLSFTYTKEEIHMLFEMMASGMWKTDIYTTEIADLDQAIEKIEELASGKLDVARVLLKP
ncbi:MAG: zinc-dependent alcohol dehydrogenase [Eubacterium sp.]|jgi:threonine dehydrogenase-like Zn-dependent dehydrogenase|uniref:zinc-dependent alcohol dehydrogenase n=1 Tax=Clostridium sp. (strain SY8519) TaxID=1042156 RepID=UPI0002171D53|nr:alcohol dehydrogenase catalytic domain-containing protein [Clostridium sp. SY8519]BAK46566.1 threonine dehydrogenase [Clostridium sp. SY8519]